MISVSAADIRISVLQAALQGKLNTNNESEGLPDIRPFLSNQKEFKEEDIPLEIPGNWEWVHLNQIASTSLGKTLNGTKDTGIEVPYLCSINIYWEGISLAKLKTAKFSERDREKYLLERGDLLICEGGDSGRACIWDQDEEMYYQNALHRARFEFDCSPEFYYWVFRLYKETGLIDQYCKGQTIKHLVQNSLYAIPFPLPPIEEQERIVDCVDELMAKINDYEKIENQLAELKKKFPEEMKAAIRKHYLLCEESNVIEEPNSMKLSEFGKFSGGQTPKPNMLSTSGTIPYFKVADMNALGNEKYMQVEKVWMKNDYAGKTFPAGSIIYPKNGGAVFTNKKRILTKPSLVDLNTGVFIPNDEIDTEFAYHVISAIDFRHFYKGTALPTVDTPRVKDLIVTVPSKEEQVHISESLNKLLCLCDEIAELA